MAMMRRQTTGCQQRNHATGRCWRLLLALMIVAIAPAGRANAAPYVFDRDHTSITFSWNHLGLSRQAGRLLDHEGTLEFDPAEPEKSNVDVTLRPSSIWTGVAALDKHLKSADFFDIGRFPAITFKSTAVKKTGERTGEVTGDLTILGTTKPVTLQVTWNFTGEHPLAKLNPAYREKLVSGFSATARLLRSEWGMKRGMPLISDEIIVTIETELFRK
ncbi:MAG TPA: YceI family protein [Hyphomicrobiaceae bacterium]|nr:YceI family protein [Hyphomicrobiaceae bacterium]